MRLSFVISGYVRVIMYPVRIVWKFIHIQCVHAINRRFFRKWQIYPFLFVWFINGRFANPFTKETLRNNERAVHVRKYLLRVWINDDVAALKQNRNYEIKINRDRDRNCMREKDIEIDIKRYSKETIFISFVHDRRWKIQRKKIRAQAIDVTFIYETRVACWKPLKKCTIYIYNYVRANQNTEKKRCIYASKETVSLDKTRLLRIN